MRRPTWGTTAAALAIGATGFLAPTAVTMVSATTNPSAVTAPSPGTTEAPAPQPGPQTAPQPAPQGMPPGAHPGGPQGRGGHPPIGEIDPTEKAAYDACLQEHGLTLPTPPAPPTDGQPPARPAMPKVDPAVVKAANEACKDKRPIPKVSDEQLAKIRAYEACMKTNGIEMTPFDPTKRPDDATPETKPRVDPETMKKAQDACKDLSPFPAPAGPPPGGACVVPGGPDGPDGPGGPGRPDGPDNGPGNGPDGSAPAPADPSTTSTTVVPAS